MIFLTKCLLALKTGQRLRKFVAPSIWVLVYQFLELQLLFPCFTL